MLRNERLRGRSWHTRQNPHREEALLRLFRPDGVSADAAGGGFDGDPLVEKDALRETVAAPGSTCPRNRRTARKDRERLACRDGAKRQQNAKNRPGVGGAAGPSRFPTGKP